MHVFDVALWRRHDNLLFAVYFWLRRGKSKASMGKEVVLTRANPWGRNGGSPYADEDAARELRWRSSKPTKASLKEIEDEYLP